MSERHSHTQASNARRVEHQWFVTAKSEGSTDFQSVARIAKARTGSPFYEFAAPTIQLSQNTSVDLPKRNSVGRCRGNKTTVNKKANCSEDENRRKVLQ